MHQIWHARRTLVPLLAVCGAVLLSTTACGGGTSTASAATGSSARPSQASPAPGAFGTIASVTTGTLEVQDPQSGQTTVTYTPSTPVTDQESATAADIAVGSCVVVTSKSAPKSGSPIAAATVSITTASANGCTAGEGFGGPRAQGLTGTAHKPATSSKNKRSSTFVRPTIGQVTTVGGQGFTVEAVQRKFGGASASASSKSASSSGAASAKTSSVSVTTGDSTTYTKTVTADASALTVGKCLTASGKADDTGSVAATVLRVSTPGPSGCSTSVRGSRFGGPGAGGNG